VRSRAPWRPTLLEACGPHPFRWTVSNLSFRPLIVIQRITTAQSAAKGGRSSDGFFFASLLRSDRSVMAQEP
jgi:hypothetical protein